MGKEKKPRWNEEVWSGTTPPKDICCKDCMFKLEPATIGGQIIERHTYGCCALYEYPDMKPHEVLWDGAQCEFWEKEEK